MTRPAAWVVVLLTLLTPLAAAHAQDGDIVSEGADDAPSPWHLDLELAYGQTEVAFVGREDVAPICGDSEPCGPADYAVETARLGAAVGHAGFHVEGSLTAPLGGAVAGYAAWSAGLRIDTGWDALLSVTLRMAYVRRVDDAGGEGGRGAIGINLRPFVGLAIYGEASADVTSVPSSMNGTFFSWSTFLGGGVRVSFGH